MKLLKIHTLDWPQIQIDHNQGLNWRELTIKYSTSMDMLIKAQKINLFKSRTPGESRKLSAIRHPRKMSQETRNKISIGRKKFLAENPDKVPYLLNHRYKKISYPEQYFTDCFKNSSITPKYRILAYELDFAHVNDKIDIEIDGEQHFLDPDIATHDQKRNNALIELGWTIYRIRWSDFKKEPIETRHHIVNSIINKQPIDSKCLLILDANPNQAKIDEYFLKLNTKGYNKCNCGQDKFHSSKQCQSCFNKRHDIKMPLKEDLQRLLYEKPMREIYKQLKCSFRLIERWCKILSIEIPKFSKGYWQRRQAGQTHEQALTKRIKNPLKRFTDGQILEIRRLLLENVLYISTIAKMFNVDRHTIHRIKDGKTYVVFK